MPSTKTKREPTVEEAMNMQDRSRMAAEEKSRKRKSEQGKMQAAVNKVKGARATPTIGNRKEMLDQAEKDAGL